MRRLINTRRRLRQRRAGVAWPKIEDDERARLQSIIDTFPPTYTKVRQHTHIHTHTYDEMQDTLPSYKEQDELYAKAQTQLHTHYARTYDEVDAYNHRELLLARMTADMKLIDGKENYK
jgi:hypothetical protein